MPKNKKSGGFKPPKNYVPGAKRAGHSRHDSDDRRAGGFRGGNAGRPERGGRNDWFDRNDRFDRASRGDRYERTERFDRSDRNDRFNRDDRAGRFDRDDRGGRDSGRRFDRDDRGYRQNRDDRFGGRDRRDRFDGDRDNRFDRSGRDDRGGRYDRDDRFDREGRGNRDERRERTFGQGERAGGERFDTERKPRHRKGHPEHRAHDDSPRRHFEQGERSRYRDGDDRPRHEEFRRDRQRDERPDRGDRPSRGDRFERSGRPERAPRSRDDRRDDFKDAVRPAFQTEDEVLDKLDATIVTAEETEKSFADLGLGNRICEALAELGAAKPFPIQAATIPEALAGRNVLGRGRTGSGKTIAFAAPIVERLLVGNKTKGKRKPGRAPRALILAPTRELALQIDRTMQHIARSVGLFTTQVVGGVPQGRQVTALLRGVDIVIGTPGRVEDLYRQKKLDLSEIEITVLDEADHMAELGFAEPVDRILSYTPDDSQRMLFSATLDSRVAAIVEKYLADPVVFEVGGEDQDSGTIDHRVFVVDHNEKQRIVEELCAGEEKVVVFTRTRAYAEMLADALDDAGIRVTALHGDLNQSRRTRSLERLTNGRARVLVATDVAARGIHVDDVTLVIQADAPDEYKTYLHRSGRTGRAGRSGTVVTLVNRNRRRRMAELLDRAEIEAEQVSVHPGYREIIEVVDAASEDAQHD